MNGTELIFAENETGAIKPHEIESVLQTLWRDSAGDEIGAAVIHVRTLNLLVFAPAPHVTPELLRAVETVSIQHPGRTITMLVHESARPPVAQVAIACRLGGSGKQLCGEQITITSGDRGAPLPSIAAALLGAGVPTFLWWLGDPPFDAPLFDSFVESADRVIVDSRTWSRPLATLAALAQAARRRTPIVGYTDLQWTALTSWRRQTAQCFDLPHAQPHLRRLREMTVTHGPDEHDRVAALLFVSWLGSRLGWSVEQPPDSPVALTLTSTDGGPGLHAVRLASDEASFELVYEAATSCIKTNINLPNSAPLSHLARLRAATLPEVVGEELNMLDHDPTFEAALQLAATLAQRS